MKEHPPHVARHPVQQATDGAFRAVSSVGGTLLAVSSVGITTLAVSSVGGTLLAVYSTVVAGIYLPVNG